MNKAQRKKTKRIVCKALLWRYMDSKSICQRPDLVEEADYLIDNGCYGKYRHVGMANIPTVFDAEGHPIQL